MWLHVTMYWHPVRQQLSGDMYCSPLTLMARLEIKLHALVITHRPPQLLHIVSDQNWKGLGNNHFEHSW